MTNDVHANEDAGSSGWMDAREYGITTEPRASQGIINHVLHSGIINHVLQSVQILYSNDAK